MQTMSTVMCLYPGIYTPGIPSGYLSHEVEYLANKSPPSNYGSDITNNAYIMNLNSFGGYIDGCALKSQYNDTNNALLDSNPSACGHLVNHDTLKNNVKILSFAWDEVLKERSRHDDAEIALENTKENAYYSIPNERRADGTPWYYDSTMNKLVSFTKSNQSQKHCLYHPMENKLVCGAALILTKSVCKGEELLLDYGLNKPYPAWAKDWYN